MNRFRIAGLLLLLPALIAVGCSQAPDASVVDPGVAEPVSSAGPANVNTVSFHVPGMT